MTTPKEYSPEAIAMFSKICLESAQEGADLRSSAFMQRVGQYLARGETPVGFAELCVMCVAGEVLPQEATTLIKTQLQELVIRANASIKELRTQTKRRESLFGNANK